MPRVCTVCAHPDRAAVDTALATGDGSIRRVAAQYGLSATSVRRHQAAHLSETIRNITTAKREEHELDVMTELHRLFDRMNLLLDACHRWLQDPDNPDQYDLAPRAHEVTVHYEDVVYDGDGEAKIRRRKAKLSDLLELARERTPDRTYSLIETKYADPRKLIVDTAARLQGQIELLAKLIGQLDERPLNIIISPEWIALRGALLDVLNQYPEVKFAVAERLSVFEGGR